MASGAKLSFAGWGWMVNSLLLEDWSDMAVHVVLLQHVSMLSHCTRCACSLTEIAVDIVHDEAHRDFLKRTISSTSMLRTSSLVRTLAKPTAMVATRSIISSTQVSSTLLAASRLKVQQSHDSASDHLGDIMVKRWLGGVRGAAAVQGTDTDRVSRSVLHLRSSCTTFPIIILIHFPYLDTNAPAGCWESAYVEDDDR